MDPMDILLGLTSVTIFTLMLTIGTNQSLQQLTSVWRQRDVLFRSLFAVVVLVPIVVGVLLWLFGLPPAVATGLAVLAAAPGAPLTTKRSQMAGADRTYIISLQLTLALLAVVITPAILTIFTALFELEKERVFVFEVASQVARVTFLPVILGLLLKHFAPKFVEVIGGPLNKVANILFLLLCVALIVVLAITPELRTKLWLGWPAFAAILIMASAALAIGHVLGGPALAQRAGLAIACIARNIGLALFIVTMGDAQQAIPALVAYLLLGFLVAFPYSVWCRRQMT